MGPDDLGGWFLTDENGAAYPLVNRWKDHPTAAQLFGWQPPTDVTDEDEVIDDARRWLHDYIGDEITAPSYVVDYFQGNR